MNMVHVVTDGEYSDYHIVGICSSLEKAKELKEISNSSNDIKQIELDLMPKVPPGMQAYSVRMDRDGNVSHSCRESHEVMPLKSQTKNESN